MKRVLYLTNIEVPYRVSFFNDLAKYCELTVLYEREKSSNRNSDWASSQKRQFRTEYLKGIDVGNENRFSFGILKKIFGRYDAVIVGCYNSPVQMMAIFVMKLFQIPYYINADGETFISGNGMKSKIKKLILSGAKGYLAAGEKSAQSLSDALGREVMPYYFSSLYDAEIKENGSRQSNRKQTILVVGQYFDYKGMDVALEAARMNPDIHYKFVGMGSRTVAFLQEQMVQPLNNVEVVSFMQKEELEQEYCSCAALLLPSRQECWGLVVNEAASFGTPIVSTWGSGASVEFLADTYPQFLARPGDARDLYEKICVLLGLNEQEREEYSDFLKEKSKSYSIEINVQRHLDVLN